MEGGGGDKGGAASKTKSSKKEEESLPPGFRFHPTDEELITYYLRGKIADGSFTARAITEVDLNKCEPWDLPGKYIYHVLGQKYSFFLIAAHVSACVRLCVYVFMHYRFNSLNLSYISPTTHTSMHNLCTMCVCFLKKYF
jgi:hypothetical protein